MCSKTLCFVSESEPEVPETEVSFYTYGLKDICATVFYTMIVVIIHAVIQEYILDVSVSTNGLLFHIYFNKFTWSLTILNNCIGKHARYVRKSVDVTNITNILYDIKDFCFAGGTISPSKEIVLCSPPPGPVLDLPLFSSSRRDLCKKSTYNIL